MASIANDPEHVSTTQPKDTSSTSQESDSMNYVGLANPASVYCEKLGGKLVIQNTQNGQIGFCHLPDGRIVEEWELFRADHKVDQQR